MLKCGDRPQSRMRMALGLVSVGLFSIMARAEVVINEIMANGSERLLRWSANGVPTLGYGTPWNATSFDDSTWKSGTGPFGFGSFANVSSTPAIGTNMATQMQNLTPTLYLRKAFPVTATDAVKTAPLTLEVQFNDGFVCYLNGAEVARRNAGPAKGFIYHDQFAAYGTPANTEPSTTPYLRTQTITLGAANTLLVAGTNLLAIHALNYWDATTLHNPTTNTTVAVDNLNNFYFKGDLKITGAAPVSLVTSTSPWRYLPGLVEPSGGIYDPALLLAAKQNVRWGRASYDDTLWATGAAPFGAGTPPAGVTLGTNLTTKIPGASTSLYLRTVFTATAADIADPLALQLLMDWDDGFVAYLNGVEVARDRMAEANAFTPHNAVASSARTPGTYTTYTLDPPSRLLIAGQNVLAVQVHNVALADADLFLRAQLRTNTSGTNHTLVAPTSTWNYLVGTEEPIEAEDDNLEDNPEAPDASCDWVELHNNGTEAVSLANWKLSDDLASPAKWTFPVGATLPAGGFLTVVCDDQNITGPASGGFYHTNFKLSAAGETLVLSNAENAIRQQVSFGQQSAFQTYGRDPGGIYVFFKEPTPGAANAAAVLTGQVAPVEFSVAAGFHPGTRSVSLSCATNGAAIRFTTDGTEPTETTGTAGTTVTVGTSQAIRARAFKPGMSPSATATRTYLINEPAGRRSVPALCLTGDQQRSLYRPFGVMAISGGSYPGFVAPAPTNMNGIWTQASGVVGGVADLTAYNNPLLRGRATEKPVNMEILRADGTAGPNIGLGLRISGSAHARPRYKLTNQNRVPGASPAPNDGAWSATDFTQKPSFNFFFRSDFGGDPLEWPLFPNYPVNTFHDLRMRAGKNDPSNPFIEDEYMRRLFIGTGQQSSRGMINTLYVNGVYKGYYNTCEHLREAFLQHHHGGENAWDVRQVTTIASGDGLAFQEMITFIRNNPQSILANYQAMATRLDLVNFADYLLTNIFGVTGDWPHNNFVCARERTTSGKHRYYLWDAEGAFGDFSGTVRTNMFVAGTTGSVITTAPSTVGFGEGIRILYTLLRASPEFKLLFADRIQKHFFNGGALTNATMLAEWNRMKTEFAPLIAPTAITDKVTPWINGVGNPTRYTTGATVNTPSRRTVLFDGYTDDVAGGTFVQPHFAAEGLWPTTKAPVLSQHGGTVVAGYRLSISHANADGTLYFTTDGSDPRETGGIIHGTAYAGPIPINYATTIKARVRRVSGAWSPLTEAAFDTGVIEPLLITELMYHPPDNGVIDGDEYEFIELKNPSANIIPLGGMSFSSGISYTFPLGTSLAPGQLVVLARIKARFMEKYPAVVPIGEWGTGTVLSNSGEPVTLVNASGRTIFSFTYADGSPWPGAADGSGYSLVPVNANSNPMPADPVFWRASTNLGGSPGADDPVPAAPTIVISEILASSVPPAVDMIELHNPNDFPVDVGHWWLSDSDTTTQKFRIPAGTTILAGGFLCFAETDFASGAIPFGFSHNGDKARLSSGDVTGALTGYSHTVSFGASNPGESLGRYLNSQGTVLFVALRSQTFGSGNSGPSVGPVVISELMHSPASGGDEFMELCNITATPVDLFDRANPANGWKVEGIGWTFPGGITLQPGQLILLTQLDPAAFRSKYRIDAAITIYGPYSGSQNGGGELIKLQQPGTPFVNDLGLTVIPYIDMDQVNYGPLAPWPPGPAGGGQSLERINLWAFGDDVSNWQASPAAGGTPGTPPAQPLAVWLACRFTRAQLSNPLTGSWDADPDGDGLNNFREWAHGLDPWSYNSNPIASWIETVGTERWLMLSVRRSRSATGLVISADISPDLENWTLGGGVPVANPADNGDGTETVTFRHPQPIGPTGRHFMRLRLTASEP